MKGIFKIIELLDREKEEKKGVAIAIDFRVADQERSLPVSRICHSHEDLVLEADAIRENLEQVCEAAKAILSGELGTGQELDVTDEMASDHVWSILSRIPDVDTFIKSFNDLGDARRREVAEYVLTVCNVFSGKALVFSSRYNSGTAFLA